MSANSVSIVFEELHAEISRLKNRVSELEAARIAYASEFPLTKDGDPDVGIIHQNIRALKVAALRTIVAFDLDEGFEKHNANANLMKVLGLTNA